MNRQDLTSIAKAIHRCEGDALQGEKVIAQARNISRVRVAAGTSTHKIQEVVLKANALCVIDKAFRLRDAPMRLKEPK